MLRCEFVCSCVFVCVRWLRVFDGVRRNKTTMTDVRTKKHKRHIICIMMMMKPPTPILVSSGVKYARTRTYQNPSMVDATLKVGPVSTPNGKVPARLCVCGREGGKNICRHNQETRR